MDYQQIDNSQSWAWAWPSNDLYLHTDASFDDICNMFDGTTRIKSCGGFAYDFDGSEILSKTSQDSEEYSSQFKRRKLLDFNSSDSDGISSSFLKSEEQFDANAVGLPELDAFLQDDFFPVAIENSGRPEAWLTELLVDTDLTFSSDDGNGSVTSDAQISTLQRPIRNSRNFVFKGRKSYMRAPSKVSSTVTYPFGVIKPSAALGEVTLEDINRLIHSPLKPRQETSAFSGKPVVGKTKIPTRGKGSITIMRTEG